jgi:hypothetical protein
MTRIAFVQRWLRDQTPWKARLCFVAAAASLGTLVLVASVAPRADVLVLNTLAVLLNALGYLGSRARYGQWLAHQRQGQP